MSATDCFCLGHYFSIWSEFWKQMGFHSDPKVKFSFSSLFQTSQLYYSTSASLQPAQKMYHCHSLTALTASEVASATHGFVTRILRKFLFSELFPLRASAFYAGETLPVVRVLATLVVQ